MAQASPRSVDARDESRAANLAISKAMIGALTALYEHGGDGVITRKGTLLAAGVELGEYSAGERVFAYSSATWLRLVAAGLVDGEPPARLRITKKGLDAIHFRRFGA